MKIQTKNKVSVLPFLLPLRCVAFLLIFLAGAWITNRGLNEISYWWSVAASLVNVVTLLLLCYAAKRRNSNYWEFIRYQKGKTTGKQIAGISAVILLLGMGGMYLAGWLCYGVIPYAAPMMIAPIPLWLAAVNLVVLPISTALAEEGLYLGCGVNQIRNPYSAVLIPALFFALQHCFIPTLFDVQYILYRFLSFLPLTLALCAYYHQKRNPLPILIGHAIIDTATAAQIFATSLVPGLFEQLCSM